MEASQTRTAAQNLMLNGLKDPKQFSAMTPITATVTYVCIALGVVLIGLLVLWAVSACCEHKKPKRRRILRSPMSNINGHCDHHLYGSTACLSTATTTSFGNESECQLVGNRPIGRNIKLGAHPMSNGFTTLSKDEPHCHSDFSLVYCSSHCTRCDKKLRSLKTVESKRLKSGRKPLKRHSSEKSKLLRNTSLYYHTDPRNKELKRTASQYNNYYPKNYKHHHLPTSGGRTDYFSESLDERSFPRMQMIPRAKLDSNTLENTATVSNNSYPTINTISQPNDSLPSTYAAKSTAQNSVTANAATPTSEQTPGTSPYPCTVPTLQ